MSEDPRSHWNRRYREGWPTEPSEFVLSLDSVLPRSGRALDVAGGNGRNAVWLVRRGLDVTVVDVSDEALRRAARAAQEAGVTLHLVHADTEEEPLPEGPWNVILCSHYLQRSLFPQMVAGLGSGGLLVCAIATVRNLERHSRPPRAYVLDEGELPTLVDGLTIVQYEEGWFGDHHEARLVARRDSNGDRR